MKALRFAAQLALYALKLGAERVVGVSHAPDAVLAEAGGFGHGGFLVGTHGSVAPGSQIGERVGIVAAGGITRPGRGRIGRDATQSNTVRHRVKIENRTFWIFWVDPQPNQSRTSALVHEKPDPKLVIATS